MEILKLIAGNIKTLRARKGLTLEEAAKLTNVSRSMLAQIEKGEVNPTISVLWKIANGYKVSFTSLIEHHKKDAFVIRAKDITPLIEDEGKYVNYPVFPFQENKSFETYRIHIKADGLLNAHPHLAGAEEYITVFSGQVEITAGQETFLLNAGDSIRFMAAVPHSYRNTGSKDAFLSMIIYYN